MRRLCFKFYRTVPPNVLGGTTSKYAGAEACFYTQTKIVSSFWRVLVIKKSIEDSRLM